MVTEWVLHFFKSLGSWFLTSLLLLLACLLFSKMSSNYRIECYRALCACDTFEIFIKTGAKIRSLLSFPHLGPFPASSLEDSLGSKASLVPSADIPFCALER